MVKRKKVLQYTAVFEADKKSGYSVWVPDLPGCASQGETLEDAQKNIKEAIDLYLQEAPQEFSNIEINQNPQFILPIDIRFPAYG